MAGIACTRQTPTSRLRRMRSDEGGFVLAFVALSITVLAGIAGISVDLGNWYLHIDRASRAADAAALAGAVYLPDDPAKASATAKQMLAANDVPQKYIDSADIRPLTAGSSQQYVRVATDVDNSFLPLLGFGKNISFSRSSVAEWQPGLGIGDYSNVLGNEPAYPALPNSDQWESAAKRAAQGQFWLGIDGGQNSKENGDRFSTTRCNNGDSGCAGGTNTEFEGAVDGVHTLGYDFMVTAQKGRPGTAIDIQIYDPVMSDSGQNCGNLGALFAASGNDLRYTPGLTDFCPGEGNGNTNTYIQLLDKAGNPVATCPNEQTFPPYGNNPSAASLNDPYFAATFHKWVNICSVPYDTTLGSQYTVRIRTDKAEQGSNHFSLRAGLFTGATGLAESGQLLLTDSQEAVAVFAKKNLPVWANFDGATTQFAIAKIPVSYAGSAVTIDLFDLGDAQEPGVLTVVSSSTSGAGASTLNCDYEAPGTTTFVPLPGCTLPNVSSQTGFQGQLFKVRWNVPADYTCDITGATATANCYMFLQLAYPAGTAVSDRTTWSAGGVTNPVHLINKPKTTG